MPQASLGAAAREITGCNQHVNSATRSPHGYQPLDHPSRMPDARVTETRCPPASRARGARRQARRALDSRHLSRARAPGATVMGVRVVVAGASGDLGARVARQVADRGHEVLPASRRSGVDLVSGEGLAEASGCDAVVNCADDPSRGDWVTVYGARRLADAAAAQACTSCTSRSSASTTTRWATTAASCARSSGIEAAGGPATVLRATQFHSLAAFFAQQVGRARRRAARRDGLPVRRHRLGRRAPRRPRVGTRPTAYLRATDLAGPDVLTVAEITALLRARRRASAPTCSACPRSAAPCAPSRSDATCPPRARHRPVGAPSPSGSPPGAVTAEAGRTTNGRPAF